MGCGSKLTTELLTWRTCPFLFAESDNKLVIRGHLLLPDNTYSEQEHGVGGQPGVLAAVGTGSSVDCFTPRPELLLPSHGPAAGWEDARGLGRRLFPRRALPCRRRARVPKPRGGPPSLSARWDSRRASQAGSGAAGGNAPPCARLCLFLPSAFPGDAIHTTGFLPPSLLA